MSSERPSPFTIPKPEYVFSEGPPSLPLPLRPMSVEDLIAKLLEFAESYELATDQIQAAPNFEKRYAVADRDCNAEYLQRVFRAVLGIDRVRTYVLSQYGEELTIASARRFLGDLIRVRKLTVAQAGALSLEEAMDRLEPDAKAKKPKPRTGGDGTGKLPSRGGRPKLDDSKKLSDKAKHNVYELILAAKEKNPDWRYQEWWTTSN